MARQQVRHVACAPRRRFTFFRIRDQLGDEHLLGAEQERQGVGDGAPGFPGVLPGHQDPQALQGGHAGRHDEDGPAGAHQHVAHVHRPMGLLPEAFAVPPEDNEVGRPGLARQRVGRGVEEGPPAGAPPFLPCRRAEPFVRDAQPGLHALLLRFQDLDRHGAAQDRSGDRRRYGSAARQPDENGAEAVGEVRSEAQARLRSFVRLAFTSKAA